jgi:hypothetical protein
MVWFVRRASAWGRRPSTCFAGAVCVLQAAAALGLKLEWRPREKLKSERDERSRVGKVAMWRDRMRTGGPRLQSWLECGTTDRMQAGPMASNWYQGGVDCNEPSLSNCAAHVLELGRVVLTDSSTTKDGGVSGTLAIEIEDES